MPNPDKPTYTHGSTGTEPASSIDYQNGDSLESENLDYFINTPFEKIKAIINTLTAIDSDGDGVVDRADSAVTADSADAYKNNDIDSDGDGKVNAADIADDATNVTSTYKGNDIDSDGDGKVDNADKVDGIEASSFFQFIKPSQINATGFNGYVDGWFTVADFTGAKKIIGGTAASEGSIGKIRYTDGDGNTTTWDTYGEPNQNYNEGVNLPPAKNVSKVEALHADDSPNDGSGVIYYL